MSQKYMLLFRNPPNQPEHSPEQMQKLYVAWKAWMEKHKAQIFDTGISLKPTGKTLSAAGVTDGPYMEGKEVVGSFAFIQADNYEDVLVIAKECLPLSAPGVRIEIREMIKY